ncbi:ATG16 family protein [Rothia sp. p3-SID1597]|nr:ATG16 family protein [Rothia sp. p3-SID1597]
MNDLIGPVLTFGAAIFGGLITWLVKKTPEKADPSQIMSEAYSRLADRVEQLEDSNAKQWGVIEELQSKVNSLWSKLRRTVAYALDLEERIVEITGEPHERPPGLDEILDDK